MIPSPPVTRLAALPLAALLLPAPARPGPPEPLRLELPRTLAVAGVSAAAVLATVLLEEEVAPPRCRVCGTNGFDTWARSELRWSRTQPARTASDVLLAGVPLAAAGALAAAGWQAGGSRTALEDLAVAAEAVSVALLVTQAAKLAVGRLRPHAWADPGAVEGRDAFLSFWSGHTAATFAGATAAGTVARLRGYRAWPWILGVGLAGAAATGWLRIASDRHWATDVLAGAAAGALAGAGLPVLLHARPGTAAAATPLPLGIAGTF
jgi:membrane-associated phospholipid phosphatase